MSAYKPRENTSSETNRTIRLPAAPSTVMPAAPSRMSDKKPDMSRSRSAALIRTTDSAATSKKPARATLSLSTTTAPAKAVSGPACTACHASATYQAVTSTAAAATPYVHGRASRRGVTRSATMTTSPPAVSATRGAIMLRSVIPGTATPPFQRAAPAPRPSGKPRSAHQDEVDQHHGHARHERQRVAAHVAALHAPHRARQRGREARHTVHRAVDDVRFRHVAHEAGRGPQRAHEDGPVEIVKIEARARGLHEAALRGLRRALGTEALQRQAAADDGHCQKQRDGQRRRGTLGQHPAGHRRFV